MIAANTHIGTDSLVPSPLAKTDNSPELNSLPDPLDLTNAFSSFSTPYNSEASDDLPEAGMSTNLALKVDVLEDNAVEEGIGSGIGGGFGSQSGGYSGTGGAGTGSSGGITPGGFYPTGGGTPGGGASPGVAIPGGAVPPGGAQTSRNSRTDGRLSAPERARRKQNAAESDKDFDCSRMEARADLNRIVGDSQQLLMGRNPKSRFCCTGGPPTSGIWDGIFYTNSPGKFVTLRTYCFECTLITTVIIRNQTPLKTPIINSLLTKPSSCR